MSDDLVIRYRDLQGFIGGCHDGYCVIKKPQGMHTNGGCNCLEDMKLHERSRVGGLLKYGQEMADRIEELEAKLAKAVEGLKLADKAIMDVVNSLDLAGVASVFNAMSTIRTTLAELNKERSDEKGIIR